MTLKELIDRLEKEPSLSQRDAMNKECPMEMKCLEDLPTCPSCKGFCESRLAFRPILYTDTIKGNK